MSFRLLVADDNKMHIESILTFVDWEKYGISEIQTTYDGEKCLSIDEWFLPHIIITDIEMPKMDGIELIRKLRENRRDVKIIIVTCHEKFEYAQKAIEYGASAFILKPIDPYKISAVVEQIISELKNKDEIEKILDENLRLYGISIGKAEASLLQENSKYDYAKSKQELIDVFAQKEKMDAFFNRYFDENIINSINVKHICNFIISTLELALKEYGFDLRALITEEKMLQDEMMNTALHPKEWLYHLVDAVIDCVHQRITNTNKYQNVVQDIKNIIDEDYCNIETVEQVADRLGISASYAKKIFQSVTGMSVFDYLYIRRMERAKVLLDDPYCKVYEIAEKLGYKSKTYFAETFRKYTGFTPTEYRRR